MHNDCIACCITCKNSRRVCKREWGVANKKGRRVRRWEGLGGDREEPPTLTRIKFNCQGVEKRMLTSLSYIQWKFFFRSPYGPLSLSLFKRANIISEREKWHTGCPGLCGSSFGKSFGPWFGRSLAHNLDNRWYIIWLIVDPSFWRSLVRYFDDLCPIIWTIVGRNFGR